MRFWPLFVLLVLSQCLSASTPRMLTPVTSGPIDIAVEPIALFPEQPDRTQLGSFTYLGGWQLTSSASAFGGLSSLAVEGRRFFAISDAGGLVQFTLGRFGHVSDAQAMPLPPACRPGSDKVDRDSESLAHDPVTGEWWVGYEWRNAICRINGDFTIGERVAHPRAMAHWPRTGGAETLLKLADGRFLVIAERDADDKRVRPALLFDRDPSDPAAIADPLGYRPPPGFSPTDAAQLPDGRILILNRRFGLDTLFTACITLVDARALRKGAVLSGRIIAKLEAPATPENFEGIAVTVDDARTIIWVISDNNFASWQRTLLLKFAVR